MGAEIVPHPTQKVLQTFFANRIFTEYLIVLWQYHRLIVEICVAKAMPLTAIFTNSLAIIISHDQIFCAHMTHRLAITAWQLAMSLLT